MDYFGNENLSIVWDNIFVAENVIKTINRAINKKEVLINFNNFDKILIKNDILIDLLDIEFINNYFSLNISSRKMNATLESISIFYRDINQGILQKNLPVADYFENLKYLKERLQEIIKFLERHIEDNKEVIATARVLMSCERPWFSILVSPLLPNHELADLAYEIKIKKEELDRQIEDNSIKRKSEIEEVLK